MPVKPAAPPLCEVGEVKTAAATIGAELESEPLNRKAAAPQFASQRLAREWQTVAAMVRCYCRGHQHAAAGELCADCQGLLDYATVRLERCRFGVEKPTCANCPVHCYRPERREQIKAVMRYVGPRMLWRHPILCLRHWWDGRRSAPLPAS